MTANRIRSLESRPDVPEWVSLPHAAALVGNAADAVVVTDASGTVHFANPAATLLLACTRSRHRHAFDAIHPDDAERARERLNVAVRTPGTSSLGEFRFPDDGSYRRLDLVAENFLRDPAVGALILTARRSEGSARAEPASRTSPRDLSLLDELREVVFRTDAAGNWTYLNHAWSELMGFPVSETLGTNFLDYVHPDEREDTIALFQAVISGGAQYCKHHTRYRTGDGEFRWVEVRSRLLHDDEGNVIGNTGTIIDISDRRQAEELLADQTRVFELGERRERAEREFVMNAAHELRTPLAAIVSAIEVLQSGAKEVPEERDAFLADIQRESDRLSRLVHALLVLARAQTGQETVSLERVRLRPIFEEIAQSLHPDDGVAVEVRCPPELSVLAARDLLEQAFSNLAANAAKHTHSGRIEFAAALAAEGWVAAEVRDTGVGIQREEHDRVVDRFYRGEGRGADGFGLGLAIVDEAVSALGGKMEMESSPGEGTTVRVLLGAAE
ncbi:MAG: PAS domain-containing sensor histidine kinase [Actinomycetota bacterium]|nr:PAS domain-containing sensor histidine kinase [Actinomycetota bacterium]